MCASIESLWQKPQRHFSPMIGNIMEILLACINQYSSVRKRQGQEIAFLTILSSPSNADPPLPTGVGRVRAPHHPSPPSSPVPLSSSWQTKWDYQSRSWEALRFTLSTFWRHYFQQLGENPPFDFMISRNENSIKWYQPIVFNLVSCIKICILYKRTV